MYVAAPAIANHEELPAAYFSLASYRGTADRLAARRTSRLRSFDDLVTAEVRPGLYRARNFHVLDIKRELKFLREDVVLRVKSPGKRSSILSLELNF